MGSVSAKVIVVLSLISTIVLASSCNLLCELNDLELAATSLRLDLEPCHNSEESDKSAGCEWDSGTLDLSRNDKFTNLTVLFTFLQYYISFFDENPYFKKSNLVLNYHNIFFRIPSVTIQSINSVRIII
ncbi:MAG: hypothetical protein AABY22_29615 [Nanoarchaeota archaeon]